MDFFKAVYSDSRRKDEPVTVMPDFLVCRSEDLMIRGKSFYAIWDPDISMWNTDEFAVQRIVDKELYSYADALKETYGWEYIKVASMGSFNSNSWTKWRKYVSSLADTNRTLDERLTFADTVTKKTDYISKRLPYPLSGGPCDAYDEIMSTLYEPEEREKIEWAIGSIITGDSRYIQKFLVLYGDAGTGKSTVLNIVQQLFEGYYVTFDAKSLTSSSSPFATEVFKDNPLVAIQHDGDLSRIEDNSKLNSIVSHEEMSINEKYKAEFGMRINAFLFMATNRPVKITDSKSGVIRRLIDVHPSGRRIPIERYHILVDRIPFELGAIACRCREVYKALGKDHYSDYVPVDMIFRTDPFFNFVESQAESFAARDGVSLKSAYEAYKAYVAETEMAYKMPQYRFRDELKDYFKEFHHIAVIGGKRIRSYYTGFKRDKFSTMLIERAGHELKKDEPEPLPLTLDRDVSLLDDILADCPAQYARDNGSPRRKWDSVRATLADIDTKRLHYVRVPENHIVIDFDLKNEEGAKDYILNLEAAAKWPPTYAELSKSGQGIHLHYIYDGDVTKLSRVYDDNIEVKVFTGKSSLRRQLTRCNGLEVAHISSGLPLKGGDAKVLDIKKVQSEKALRVLIKRNLCKEIHPGTKPSVDFIKKILDDAYESDLHYDVSDLYSPIMTFASQSTNHALYCMKLVDKMKFHSDDPNEPVPYSDDAPLVFFDVEVFPNLFVLVWKKEGKDCSPVKMINPTPEEIEDIIKFKLVGFNCRKYDNHILYARLIGKSNLDLYKISQKLINGERGSGTFREAYNISYTDIYDFSSKKQSLKKFEIELGIHHQELGLPWDQPVVENLWEQVADYCVNDVVATEAVFNARHADFVARQILADLTGLTVNDTTQQHTARLIFGNDPNPQSKFVYTDLSEMFPGYKFEYGKSWYRGEDPKEGGYVYAEPGMYGNVALLDVASMHPSSIINLNLFGPYTDNFKQLMDARLAIKHGEFNRAREMFGGKLARYLVAESDADQLAYALKIVINIVYGLTSAKFDNKFRDPRNVDNIVAKRGALFMIDLKHAVQEKGYTVAHIKTDSIKIPDADADIIEFVMEFGKKYGYIFEHEATYEKMCLVNDAVYIAKYDNGEWTATGAQFQHPVVFKTLFSKEPIEFSDYCETKTVTTALYLDMNEGLREDEHDYKFVGRAGSFCPIKPGCGGGLLVREKDGKYYAATGTKGFRWLEAEVVETLGKQDDVDTNYAKKLVDDAVNDISEYGDFEWFASDAGYEKGIL